MQLDSTKALSDANEKALAYMISIKASQSTATNKLIEVKNGGPQPITYAPVTVVRKSSGDVSARTLRKTTENLTNHLELVAGNTNEALLTQVTHMVKSFDERERENIVKKKFKCTVTIPASHLASMRSTLNLSWYTTRKIRRWLKTFKVDMASEGKARDVIKEWVGTGLRTEEIPASVVKGKQVVVVLTHHGAIYTTW